MRILVFILSFLFIGISIVDGASISPTQNEEWLNLLYYELDPNGSFISVADDPGFFVTPSGNIDPSSEYFASLQLTHAQDVGFKTKFPLRYKKIAEWHNIPYTPVVTVNSAITKVRIAFPNRYLGNPASMFGHLFLVLESENGLPDSQMLHYLANTDGADSVGYIVNGITGKFKGRFLAQDYYSRIKEYNYIEDREIFYYALQMTPEQIYNLQLHAKELNHTHFNYYFFDKNCAYFTGKLINVGLDRTLFYRTSIAFPSQVINTLLDSDLVTKQWTRIPISKAFLQKFNQLTPSAKEDVLSLLTRRAPQVGWDPDVLNTFLTVSEKVINVVPPLSNIIRENRVLAFQSLPTDSRTETRQFPSEVPIKRILSSALDLRYRSQGSVEFAYRPIFYDSEDAFQILEVKQVDCLSSTIGTRGSVLFYQLDLVNIESKTQFNPVNDSYSWTVSSLIGVSQSLYTHHGFQIGYALPWVYGVWTATIGGTLGNFNDMTQHDFSYLLIAPAASVVGAYNLNADVVTQFGYQYRFNQHFLTTSLMYRVASNFIVGSQWILGQDDNQFNIMVSTRY